MCRTRGLFAFSQVAHKILAIFQLTHLEAPIPHTLVFIRNTPPPPSHFPSIVLEPASTLHIAPAACLRNLTNHNTANYHQIQLFAGVLGRLHIDKTHPI